VHQILRLAVLCLWLPTFLASQVEAQSTSQFILNGRVIDGTQAPIAGVNVTAFPSQGPSRSTLTDQRGEFTLTLDAGIYTIHVRSAGFLETRQTLTAIASGSESREFALVLAGFSDRVTVSGAAPGYTVPAIESASKTSTPLLDVPQSVSIVTSELMKNQLMTSVADVVRYVPGVTSHQGENNRDQVIIRGNSSSADFFVNGVRDDAQYYRDLYNLERIEALKGPNAMIFGRGGAGGVINRVTKDAGFQSLREFSLQGGTYDNKRLTVDLDEPLNAKVAFRLNAMLENSNSFRQTVGLERSGLTPTLTLLPGTHTTMTVRFEHLNDERRADRGITSFQGKPAAVDPSTFYGNPALSDVQSDVNLTSATIEHRFGRATLRNHTLYGDYDRFYQNFVPGAALADGSQVAMTAYNNASHRRSLFNQTDVTLNVRTGRFQHALLTGAEASRQLTDNFRNTGFFNNASASLLVPFDSPTIDVPVTFRQNTTDADNHVRATVLAGYGQDQIALSPHVQVVAGVRVEQFNLDYHNNRNGETLDRPDTLVSPRTGVIVKPMAPLSIYSAYSTSYLPSSGDQFSSLTVVTEQAKPERLRNYEVGAKWDLTSPGLALTTALYRLNRTHTRSTDPNDPTRIVQTGSSRTNGYELGLNGQLTSAWSVAGGYAYQNAFVTSATVAAQPGQQAAQVPHHTLSLWNHYQVHPRVAAGLGILRRSDMFATIDNTVRLEGYTRLDAGAFVTLSSQVRLQLNLENMFDTRYFVNADSNTNISPGFPRTLRIGFTTRF